MLHAEIDEHKRKRTLSIAGVAKTSYQYQKLLRRFGEFGAVKNAA